MRSFIFVSFFILASILSAPLLVNAEIGANGSVCDLNGAGSGGGLMYNGQCLAPSYYPTQSAVTGTSGGGSGVTLFNPLKSGTSLESFLGNILDFIIRIGTIAIILMLVYVGYLFVVAQGNESKITAARTALLWTVVGALVLLGAQAIASAIQATVSALGG